MSKEQTSGFANTTINSSENMYFNSNFDEDSGYCPRTLIRVDGLYEVNTLLDRGAASNIISLDLVKRLKIKELLQTCYKYITVNGEKSQALGIAQNITINIQSILSDCTVAVERIAVQNYRVCNERVHWSRRSDRLCLVKKRSALYVN